MTPNVVVRLTLEISRCRRTNWVDGSYKHTLTALSDREAQVAVVWDHDRATP